jgi:hypothetical protein
MEKMTILFLCLLCLALAILYAKAALERNSLRAKYNKSTIELGDEIMGNKILEEELAKIKNEKRIYEFRMLKLRENNVASLVEMMHERIKKDTFARKCRGLETSVSQLNLKLKRLEKLRRWPDGRFKKFLPAVEDSDAD